MFHLQQSHGKKWRLVGWGLASGVLLTPLVAMQFTPEVKWTLSDFTFAAVLIGSVGLLYEFTVRRSANLMYRGGVAAALAASFLTVWINGAVGMIGSEDNPYNLIFLGVILVALVGATISRFEASGMGVAMAVAALAQAVAGMIGTMSDLRGGLFSIGLAVVWLFSAALFRHAANRKG